MKISGIEHFLIYLIDYSKQVVDDRSIFLAKILGKVKGE